MLNKLARWWLVRNGCTILPPSFLGVVVGGATAAVRTNKEISVVLTAPLGVSEIIALNHSLVIAEVIEGENIAGQVKGIIQG